MAEIGVKIKLEGAPQYTESMKNLTAQTKLYQAQVKNLQTTMGSGVSAFQKSITMQKALGQQLDAQKNKSKLLEEQIQKNIEKYGEDSTQVIKLKTQYQNLQTEIAKTEKELSDMGGTWGAVSSQMKDVSNKLSAVGEKISAVGAGLTKGITAPILGIGAASVAAFKEVDAGLDIIAQKTGASGEALKEMEDVAKNIATTIPTSFEEAGNAVGEVNTRFGLTGEALDSLSTKFIEFAQLNGTQVSTSIDNVQAAMAAFGLQSDQAGNVLDILNKAGQDSGISMDKLATSLLANASALTEMGWDISSAAGFIANLEKNGIDASTAMTGLKKAFQNASKDGISMEDAMKNLQETMKNSESDTESYQAAIELFGAKAGPAIAKALKEGKLSFDQTANSIKGFSDSVSSTFETTKDPIDEFQTNMNKIKLVGADLVNAAAPLITSVMEKMSTVIEKVSNAWNSLSEEQQQMIVKIALIAAAIGPVLSVIGKVISVIGTVGSAISTVVGWIPAISGALSTVGAVIGGTLVPAIGSIIAALAPFLPVIAAVAAAIAGVILVVKNWAEITEFVKEKWELLKEFLSEALTNIEQFFIDHFGIIGQLFVTRIEVIKTIISTAIQVIKVVLQTFGQVAKALFNGDWTAIGTILKDAWTKIKEIIKSGVDKVWTLIKNMASNIVSSFTSLGSSALNWGKDMIQNFIDGVKAKWQALKDAVKDVADTVKSYLHFSTGPDIGPMKDFNSWPRHMMQNYAEGIEAAQYLVKDAIADVAADVAVLSNPFDSSEMYEAVRAGASDANLTLSIGEREFSRALRNLGVSF